MDLELVKLRARLIKFCYRWRNVDGTLQIIPIPGSANTKRVAENILSANVTLTSEEKKEINDFLDSFEIQGTRYPAQAMAHLVSLS